MTVWIIHLHGGGVDRNFVQINNVKLENNKILNNKVENLKHGTRRLLGVVDARGLRNLVDMLT